MKPRANMKATMMSQRVFSAKPLRLSVTGRVPVMAVRPTPIMATAPMGSGRRMMPRMVATKMAKRCRPRTQSDWCSFSASALVLASASAFTLASASALTLAAASSLAFASASACCAASSLAESTGFLAAALGSAGLAAASDFTAAGLAASAGFPALSAGLAALSPGLAPLSPGLAAAALAPAVPAKSLPSGSGATLGRTK